LAKPLPILQSSFVSSVKAMSFNSTNMFSSFNKVENRGARIGNWVEENALESLTTQSRYGDFKDPSNQLKTPARVIAHTEQELAKDYRTTSHRDDPAQNSEFKIPSGLGPRALKRQQQFENTSKKAEFEEKPVAPTEYVTQARATFSSVDPSSYAATRVPRGRGGSAIREGTAGNLDAATLSMTRRQLAEQDDAKVGSGDYVQDTPVSLYSMNLSDSNNNHFPSTVASGANPFGRSTHFTNDIRDSTKTHAECCDEGGLQVTTLGPNAHQRAAVEKVRSKLQAQRTDVMSILDHSGNMQLNKSDFRKELSKFDVEVTDKELAVVFSYFDRNGNGWVSFNEFMLALQ